MKTLLAGISLLLLWFCSPALARDELVTATQADGQSVPYILTTADGGGAPTHAVILMPGGGGILNPRMEGAQLVFGYGANFLIRSRGTFADRQFVAASTDATTTPGRILAIAKDLERRYPRIAVYVVGTSRSTESTMALSAPLDGQVAGFVHTSSMNAIASFDPRKFKSRHLMVYHRQDGCRVTRPTAADSARRSYGTELIVMEGGKTVGDDCEARAYHGFNGIESETVARIKEWMLKGR